MTRSNTAASYVVRYTTVIDRPCLRGAGFLTTPAPGTVVVTRDSKSSHGAAVREFEAICRGEYDFSSEYVRDVEVYAVSPSGAITRTVRTKIDRRDLGRVRAMTPIHQDADLRITAIAAHASLKGNSFTRMHVSWVR